MISSAIHAVQDIFSPPFRKVFWKALAMTVILFIVLLIAIEVTLSLMVAFPWPWLETILAVATGLGVFAAFFFLMAPVTALFAGVFLDEIAEQVERRNYPTDKAGIPLSSFSALITGLQFGLLVLLVNLFALPLLFFGIGAAIMWIANAYLLGREYFTMIATRHMSPRNANTLRKANAGKIFTAGLIPAGLSHIPLLNLLVPFFATAFFVHIYKRIIADEQNLPVTPMH